MTPALKLVSTLLVALASATVYWNTGRQFETVESIPNQYFKEKKTIEGEVVRVTDGDTIRMRHLPTPISKSDYTGGLKEHTLAVRLYAIDAPETAKFGNPGQPFAVEATKFVEEKMLKKRVHLKLLSRDKYGRALGKVSYQEIAFPYIKGRMVDMSEELVTRGLAVVYRQGGANYDGNIAKWNALENSAKKRKVGIWSQNAKTIQLPSDYKKKTGSEKDNGTLKPSKRGIRRYQEVSGDL